MGSIYKICKRKHDGNGTIHKLLASVADYCGMWRKKLLHDFKYGRLVNHDKVLVSRMRAIADRLRWRRGVYRSQETEYNWAEMDFF